MEIKDLLPIVLSLITLLISLFFFYLTYRQTRKSNNLPILIEYLGEWRKENGIKESFYFLMNNFTVEDIRNDLKYTLNNIPDAEKRKHAKHMAHCFDKQGLLIYSEALEKEYVISFIGSNAHKAWEILKSYIIAQRAANFNDRYGVIHYQRKFEYFAKLYELHTDAINSKLDKLVDKMGLIQLY